MGRTAVVTHGHKSRAVQEEKMDKDLAHIPPGEGGTSLWVFGELVTHKIPSHKTGGAYALFEVTTPPGAGSPPHAHHREDESFYVMEGEYEFLIEGGTIRVRAGSLLYFPKGTLHAHRGLGEGAGKMLVTQTPGACTSASSRRSVRHRTAVVRRSPRRTGLTWRRSRTSGPNAASRWLRPPHGRA